MARNSPAILMFALAGLAVALAGGGAGGESGGGALFQQALDSLQKGDYQAAELNATASLDLNPDRTRGWLVIASARQHRKMYDQAVGAYKTYLASCPSTDLRQFVLDQIQFCRQAAAGPAPLQAASADLTADDRAELAKVDETTFTESGEHFVVRSRNARLSKLMAAYCESTLDRICQGILGGQEFPHSVQVFVWTDARDYRANAHDAPEWSSGSFSVKTVAGVVSRRIDMTQLEPDGKFSLVMLDRVLPHEMCHMVTRELFGDANCPLFLNEGLAMLAETQVDNGRLSLAGAALAGKEKITLESLLISRRDNITQVDVFYAEAYSFTDFLRARLCRRQFRDFIDHLRGGCTVADALQRALYAPGDDDTFLPALSAAWQDQAIQNAQLTRALLDK